MAKKKKGGGGRHGGDHHDRAIRFVPRPPRPPSPPEEAQVHEEEEEARPKKRRFHTCPPPPPAPLPRPPSPPSPQSGASVVSEDGEDDEKEEEDRPKRPNIHDDDDHLFAASRARMSSDTLIRNLAMLEMHPPLGQTTPVPTGPALREWYTQRIGWLNVFARARTFLSYELVTLLASLDPMVAEAILVHFGENAEDIIDPDGWIRAAAFRAAFPDGYVGELLREERRNEAEEAGGAQSTGWVGELLQEERRKEAEEAGGGEGEAGGTTVVIDCEHEEVEQAEATEEADPTRRPANRRPANRRTGGLSGSSQRRRPANRRIVWLEPEVTEEVEQAEADEEAGEKKDAAKPEATQ